MRPSTLRSITLVGVLVFGAFVAWYIWQLQAVYFFAWLVFPGWLLASFVVHGDTPQTMGWRADNLCPRQNASRSFLLPALLDFFSRESCSARYITPRTISLFE